MFPDLPLKFELEFKILQLITSSEKSWWELWFSISVQRQSYENGVKLRLLSFFGTLEWCNVLVKVMLEYFCLYIVYLSNLGITITLLVRETLSVKCWIYAVQ